MSSQRYDRILIPTDGTEASQCAVTHGIDIAADHDADVHVLYVVETERSLGHVDFVVERQEDQGEAAIESVAQQAESLDISVTRAFRYGETHEEIVDYATVHDADVIVMGTHGRSGFARIKAGGSVADRVVRDATVPVLVAGKESCSVVTSAVRT